MPVPPALLLAPAAVLVLGALLGVALERAGIRSGRAPAALGAWAALLLLAVSWALAHSPQDLAGPQLGVGGSLSLRLDALSFAFACALLAPAGLLLSLQPRNADEACRSGLITAGILLTVEAGSLLGAAFWLGAAGLLLLVELRLEEGSRAELLWPRLAGGWLLLLLAAASLQAIGGTSGYDALPEPAVRPAVFCLIAGASLLVSGLVPATPWAVRLWRRPRLQAAGLAVALLVPAGLYLLTRALDLAGGAFPASWLGPLLLALGLLTAAGAALRAQAARGRRELMAELVPLSGGFALLALGIGTQGGLIASVTAVLSAGLVAAAAPLLPDRGRAASLLTAGLAAGIPPGLGFGSLLLVAIAAIEARQAYAVLALLVVATWILGLAAAARVAWLPPARPAGGARLAPALLAGLLLAGGVALPALLTLVAIPAADEVARPTAEPVAATLLGGVTSAAGGWPAFSLGLPVGLLALLLAAGSRRAWLAREAEAGEPPARFFPVPGAAASGRLALRLRALRIPEEYRSLVDLRALERAVEGGGAFLWLGVLIALAIAVTR